jgi:hypothetical protein
VLKAFKHIGSFAQFIVQHMAHQIAVNEARMRGRGTPTLRPIADRQDERQLYTSRLCRLAGDSVGNAGTQRVRQKLARRWRGLGQIYRDFLSTRHAAPQHEETAKALGISTASVKTRLLRAA